VANNGPQEVPQLIGAVESVDDLAAAALGDRLISGRPFFFGEQPPDRDSFRLAFRHCGGC
jgi:hypothetical protein